METSVATTCGQLFLVSDIETAKVGVYDKNGHKQQLSSSVSLTNLEGDCHHNHWSLDSSSIRLQNYILL